MHYIRYITIVCHYTYYQLSLSYYYYHDIDIYIIYIYTLLNITVNILYWYNLVIYSNIYIIYNILLFNISITYYYCISISLISYDYHWFRDRLGIFQPHLDDLHHLAILGGSGSDGFPKGILRHNKPHPIKVYTIKHGGLMVVIPWYIYMVV